MGLAASQARLLTLTARKSDVELGISIDSMRKMALTREMSNLSAEYSSRLKSKQLSYYSNGEYNKINYSYLMGSGNWVNDKSAQRADSSVILTDYKGQVVLNNTYAEAICDVLGSNLNMDSSGSGGTFNVSYIPAIIARLTYQDEDEIANIINTGNTNSTSEYMQDNYTAIGLEYTGSSMNDNTDAHNEEIKSIVDMYYPVLMAAATNGWTTEYNEYMSENEDYLSDALVSGIFQLEKINNAGEYDEGTTLTYFIETCDLKSRSTEADREALTAWYNAEKEAISEKETLIDIDMKDLSAELDAIKQEMESLKSLISDAISSVFDWGSQ